MGVQNGSIDLNKIDESKCIIGSKGGKHLNIAIIETPNNEYNTHMIVTGTTKEERDKNIKGDIIGGIKRWKDDKPTTPSKPQSHQENKDSGESLPF